jgi:hypothetical protein
MIEQRLFRLAYEAIALTANYRPGEGWRLTVTARRQDESWSEAQQVVYDRLTTDELADVICVEASDRLREG